MPLSYVIATDNAPPFVDRAQDDDGVAGRGDGGGGEKQSVLRGDIHIMQQMYCIVHLPQSIVRELSSKSCDCFVEDAIRDT